MRIILAISLYLIVAEMLDAQARHIERRTPATAYALRMAADSLRNTK